MGAENRAEDAKQNTSLGKHFLAKRKGAGRDCAGHHGLEKIRWKVSQFFPLNPVGKSSGALFLTGETEEAQMLSWTLLFLVIAIIAGILGFWVVAGLAAWIAKVLFVIFLIFLILSLISGRKPPPV